MIHDEEIGETSIVDPETGQTYIYDSVRGKTYIVPAGGSTDEGGSGEEESEEEGGGSQEGSGGSGSSEEGSKGGSDGQAVTRADYDQLMNRMKAADRRADAAEQKVQEYEDKDKTELQKAKDDLQTVESQRDALQKEVTDLKTRLAVVTAPEAQKFHDLDDVLLRVDLEDLTDDKGEVQKDQVSSALTKLAEDKKHLVKQEESGDGDEEEDEDEEGKPPHSGRSKGNRKGGKSKYDRQKLSKKYPALRT